MTLIRARVPFSGVPAGTVGRIEPEGTLWKVTWTIQGRDHPLVDWFDEVEKQQYLEEVSAS